MPDPIPAMLLARLAVDVRAQREGIGRHLLRDAMLRTLSAAEMPNIRVLLVHAIDERAKAWCREFDFEESPTDPLQLILLLDDLRHHLSATPKGGMSATLRSAPERKNSPGSRSSAETPQRQLPTIGCRMRSRLCRPCGSRYEAACPGPIAPVRRSESRHMRLSHTLWTIPV